MFWLKKKENTGIIKVESSLSTSFAIPEPTKSLLWTTNEDVSKIRSAMQITLSISISFEGVDLKQEKNSNLAAEPSLIWTKLPVKPNADLEEKALYWPAYSALTPEQRYQYLCWLKDVEQQTNLSYVFLYFYGLERHLLIGKYQEALAEALRLLKHHNKGSFHAYAERSLLAVALHRNDKEFLSVYPATFKEMTNELLLFKRLMGMRLESKEIMDMASRVGLQNKRFIKLYPDEFEVELEKLVAGFEYENGPILDFVPNDSLEVIESPVLANPSLKEIKVKIPQLLWNDEFKEILRKLLEEAHANLKAKRKR